MVRQWTIGDRLLNAFRMGYDAKDISKILNIPPIDVIKISINLMIPNDELKKKIENLKFLKSKYWYANIRERK